MTLPARRRRVVSAEQRRPYPLPVPEHVPQPDFAVQETLAFRFWAGGIDAPIDASARCVCGCPIVNDEFYGWMHARLVACDKPATAAPGVARGPRSTPVEDSDRRDLAVGL